MYPLVIVLEKNKTKKCKPIICKETIALPEDIFNAIHLWVLTTFKNRNIDTFVAIRIQTMRKETIP